MHCAGGVADGHAVVGFVHVALAGPAQRVAGGYLGLGEAVAMRGQGDMNGSLVAASLGGAEFVILEFRISLADMLPVPVFAGLFRQRVKIGGHAANIHHAVDRCRAAQYPASCPIFGLVRGRGFRLAFMRPDMVRIGHDLGDALWHVYQGILVARSGLEQQHLVFRPFRETIGEHATSST